MVTHVMKLRILPLDPHKGALAVSRKDTPCCGSSLGRRSPGSPRAAQARRRRKGKIGDDLAFLLLPA